jgi:hypothetical protein
MAGEHFRTILKELSSEELRARGIAVLQSEDDEDFFFIVNELLKRRPSGDPEELSLSPDEVRTRAVNALLLRTEEGDNEAVRLAWDLFRRCHADEHGNLSARVPRGPAK